MPDDKAFLVCEWPVNAMTIMAKTPKEAASRLRYLMKSEALEYAVCLLSDTHYVLFEQDSDPLEGGRL